MLQLGYIFGASQIEDRTLVVPAWIFGIAGIWVSGKPCALRDWIRLCAGSKTWRSVSAAFWCILTLALFWSAAMTTGE